jgi:glycosyltransferase involved in cell wall biosynthesis
VIEPERGKNMPQSNQPALESVWCAVPVYNNRETVRQVVAACRDNLSHVVVVDDGSTDADLVALLADLDVTVLQHTQNLGKGQAILTASRYIEAQGGQYMITIDADGQHLPQDLQKFLPLLQENDPAIIIGCRDFTVENVPASSRFGRSFANFWLLVETGKVVGDCQSGFRAYPVRYLNRMEFKAAHYDFEAEVLAKAAWGGLALTTVDIDVIYPKPEERVSSFKPFLDNLRLTGIHSMLVGRRMLPIRHQKLVERKSTLDVSLLRHPGKVLRMLLKESATPEGLALSAAVGMFIAVLPILFMHSIVIFYFSMRFNLNKIVTLNVQHLAVPPFIPALCIEVGYYLRHGSWLTDLSFATVFQQFSSRFFEWFLGSLVIAPLAALVAGVVMYVTAAVIKKVRFAHASKEGC